MFDKKPKPKHNYEFTLEIRSDEQALGPTYEVSYSKIIEDLPYTPFIGLSISGMNRPLKITEVYLMLSEDRTYITLEDTVGSVEQIEKYLEKAEPYLIEDGWKPWRENIRPDKSKD